MPHAPCHTPSAHTKTGIAGFTLVEMLVVVTLIVIMIAMLLPALGRVRAIASGDVCAARMNQLFKGHQLYSTDHQGRFPHYNDWLWKGPQGGDSSNWVEYGQIWPYVSNREMYFCPKDTRTRDAGALAIGSGGAKGNSPIHTYVRLFEPHQTFRMRLESGGVPAAQAQRAAYHLRVQSIGPKAFAPLPGSIQSPAVYDAAPQGPSDLALLFEEATTETDYVGPDTSWALLNDGYSYFTFIQDMMTSRHLEKGHVVYYDGRAILMDTQKFNDWPVSKDPYAEHVVFGIPY